MARYKVIDTSPRFIAVDLELNPAAWLRETLEKLPTCRNRDIDSLLPLAPAS